MPRNAGRRRGDRPRRGRPRRRPGRGDDRGAGGRCGATPRVARPAVSASDPELSFAADGRRPPASRDQAKPPWCRAGDAERGLRQLLIDDQTDTYQDRAQVHVDEVDAGDDDQQAGGAATSRRRRRARRRLQQLAGGQRPITTPPSVPRCGRSRVALRRGARSHRRRRLDRVRHFQRLRRYRGDGGGVDARAELVDLADGSAIAAMSQRVGCHAQESPSTRAARDRAPAAAGCPADRTPTHPVDGIGCPRRGPGQRPEVDAAPAPARERPAARTTTSGWPVWTMAFSWLRSSAAVAPRSSATYRHHRRVAARARQPARSAAATCVPTTPATPGPGAGTPRGRCRGAGLRPAARRREKEDDAARRWRRSRTVRNEVTAIARASEPGRRGGAPPTPSRHGASPSRDRRAPSPREACR